MTENYDFTRVDFSIPKFISKKLKRFVFPLVLGTIAGIKFKKKSQFKQNSFSAIL